MYIVEMSDIPSSLISINEKMFLSIRDFLLLSNFMYIINDYVSLFINTKILMKSFRDWWVQINIFTKL